MDYNIVAIPGDGIGPEIVREAKKVLDKVGEVYGHKFNYTDILMGGCSIDAYGVPLTDEALETARNSDAVLLGAVGGNVGNSRWYDVAPNLRPEAGLLNIRKGLGLFANIRPAYLFEQLADACPLKKEIIGNGFDMVIMRELTGGVYFGARSTEEKDGELYAVDSMPYSEHEIRRIAVKGFEIAMKRRKKLVSVDKANVLDSSRLWRKIVEEVAKENNLTEIESVTVEIGEVSTVIESYLQNCWKWSVEKKSDIMHNCKLHVEKIPAITYCQDCGNKYETVTYGKTCPKCNSTHTYLLQGNEFNIKEIEGC